MLSLLSVTAHAWLTHRQLRSGYVSLVLVAPLPSSGLSCIIVGTCCAAGTTLGDDAVANLGGVVGGADVATLRAAMAFSVGLSLRVYLKMVASCWSILVYLLVRGLNGDAGCGFFNAAINSSAAFMARSADDAKGTLLLDGKKLTVSLIHSARVFLIQTR